MGTKRAVSGVSLDKLVLRVGALQKESEALAGELDAARKDLRKALEAGKGYHAVAGHEALLVSQVQYAWSVGCLQETLGRREFENYCPRAALASPLRKRCNEDPEFDARVKKCRTEKLRTNLVVQDVSVGP